MIHFLVNPNNSGLALFFDEKELLIKEAKNKGIELSIKPFRAFMAKNNKIIVFKWFLNHDACPFLINDSCAIYDKRPLICRSFPLMPKMGSEKHEDFIFSKLCISGCEAIDELLPAYEALTNKQNKLIEKISGIAKLAKTSTVMRLANCFENLEEFQE
jgi:Fe-S-cluster containining protein